VEALPGDDHCWLQSKIAARQFRSDAVHLHPLPTSTVPGRLNPYQQAIHSVCSVLAPYDTDKMYPVYGFGAKVRKGGGEGRKHCCLPLVTYDL
jgi:hypothetical protein